MVHGSKQAPKLPVSARTLPVGRAQHLDKMAMCIPIESAVEPVLPFLFTKCYIQEIIKKDSGIPISCK